MATVTAAPTPALTLEPAVAEEQPKPVTRESSPSAMDMLDELLALAGGLGFFFIAFLSAIPGLVPAVVLVVGPLLLLAVPLLALGVIGAVGAGLWLLTRGIFRLFTGHAGA